MKHYKVESPLLHDKQRYEPGDTVEMDEDAAEPLVERGRLKGPVEAPAKSEGGTGTAPAPSSEAFSKALEDAMADLRTANRENDELHEQNNTLGRLNKELSAKVERLQAQLAAAEVNDGIAASAGKPAAGTEPTSPKGKAKPATGGKEKPGS